MRVDCSAKTPIPPAAPQYEWDITKPDGAHELGDILPLTFTTDEPGNYSISVAATVNRACAPPPHPVGTTTFTVVGDEVDIGGTISSELSTKLSLLADTVNTAVAIICDIYLEPAIGIDYTHSRVCCPNTNGTLADKHQASGSAGGAATIEFCVPGSEGDYSLTYFEPFGSVGISYKVGPTTKLEVGGVSVSLGGVYVGEPCESGCVALEFDVPFGLAAGAGVEVKAWLDAPFLSPLVGNANVEAEVTCGGIEISGGIGVFGTACPPSHTEVVVAPIKASFSASLEVCYEQECYGPLETSYEVTLWDGFNPP